MSVQKIIKDLIFFGQSGEILPNLVTMGIGTQSLSWLKLGCWLFTKGKQMITIDFQLLLTFEIHIFC